MYTGIHVKWKLCSSDFNKTSVFFRDFQNIFK